MSSELVNPGASDHGNLTGLADDDHTQYAETANNLSDLASASTAKTNLSLVKSDVGLGNVDNTSDADKPVSTATQTALDGKEDSQTRAYTQDTTPPAFGAEVTVGASVIERLVAASITVQSGVSTASSVNVEVEDAVGSGTFDVVCRSRASVGLGGSFTETVTFAVEGGRKYKFVENETGGSRSIVHYSFRDLS